MGQGGGAVSKEGKASEDSWLFDCCGLEYSGLFYFSGQKLWARAWYVDIYVSIYQTITEHTLHVRYFSKHFKNINVN